MPRPDRRAGLTVTLGTALLLSGCATFNPFIGPEQRVDAALRDHQYQRALAIIDHTGERHPQHALLLEQREGVLQASREYRLQAQAHAEELAEREQWPQAFEALTSIRDQVVETAALDDQLARLQLRHDLRLRDLLNQAYLAEAGALLRTDSVDEALAPYVDRRAREARHWRTQRRELLYRGLLEQGQAYAADRQWQRALSSLETARLLHPEAPVPDNLEKARRVLHSARDQARDARDRAHRQEAEQRVDRYRESGKLADLLAARTFLQQHRDDDQLTPLREQVDAWAQQRVQRSLERGEALYVKGDYQGAYRLWQSVAPLDPGNPELLKKLERGGKVLENLRSLEN
ncbi:MAG: hypothetical protein MK005_12060 [Alcanivorax sp.]|nr:hypothetical protein [Alcanivorax sp.]